MANLILHKAETRGYANHGWLQTHHTFSFANYYDPGRVHFGALRVLNDDTVQAGMGFDMHPHDNMEIITIPLEGDLAHKDSMGNASVIRSGDIQVMSAGTGIFHSEYNANDDQPVKLLQIWVFPNQKNVTPRYGQITLDPAKRHNRLQQVLSPVPEDEGVWIYQDAWFHLGHFDKGFSAEYTLKKPIDGVYVFVISGGLIVAGQPLTARDGLGIRDTGKVSIRADSESEFLIMEVPMN